MAGVDNIRLGGASVVAVVRYQGTLHSLPLLTCICYCATTPLLYTSPIASSSCTEYNFITYQYATVSVKCNGRIKMQPAPAINSRRLQSYEFQQKSVCSTNRQERRTFIRYILNQLPQVQPSWSSRVVSPPPFVPSTRRYASRRPAKHIKLLLKIHQQWPSDSKNARTLIIL